MALVLSLRAEQDFYVGEERFAVVEILTEHSFSIRRDSDGKCYTIGADERTEVLPDVFVSAGPKPEAMVARVAIDAPRSMLVLRGDRKRNPPSHIIGLRY